MKICRNKKNEGCQYLHFFVIGYKIDTKWIPKILQICNCLVYNGLYRTIITIKKEIAI